MTLPASASVDQKSYSGAGKIKSRTVRELAGEIWAEINYYYRKQPDLSSLDLAVLNTFLDVAMGTLARHSGEVITNDVDLPVEPRPEGDESERFLKASPERSSSTFWTKRTASRSLKQARSSPRRAQFRDLRRALGSIWSDPRFSRHVVLSIAGHESPLVKEIREPSGVRSGCSPGSSRGVAG